MEIKQYFCAREFVSSRFYTYQRKRGIESEFTVCTFHIEKSVCFYIQNFQKYLKLYMFYLFYN